MIARPKRRRPRQTVRDFAKRDYVPGRGDLRPASVEQIFLSIDLLALWAEREVFCDELSRELLLEFRTWRLAQRPLPVCRKHPQPMRKLRGTTYRCPQRDCRATGVHVAAAKPATANKNTRTLVALWYEAIDQGRNEQPKKRIRPLREELDNLPCWTPEELSRVLASCRQEPREARLPCPTEGFWLALLLVAYDSASRISAIMEAAPSDVDWAAGTLTLRAKTTKGRKCKVVGLSEQTKAALKAIYDPAWAYLFPWPFDRTQRPWRALTSRLKRILTRAGLPAGKIHLFHKIRRTTATEITIKRGIGAARAHLDHSAESVTQRYIDQRRLDTTKQSALILPRPQIDAG